MCVECWVFVEVGGNLLISPVDVALVAATKDGVSLLYVQCTGWLSSCASRWAAHKYFGVCVLAAVCTFV